jgi:hypothetical protein
VPTCLYCQQSSRAFNSEEHMIPESLGNQGHGGKPPIVLPPGVVCDRCNHGKLSQLDHALITYAPISLMRTLYGVTSKRGKLPEAKLGNATLCMFEKGHIWLEPSSKKAIISDGRGRRDLRLIGNRPMTPRYCRTLARGLFKMTLGLMYLDRPETALSERFDPVRRMILGAERFHGYLVTLNDWMLPSTAKDAAGLQYRFLASHDGRETVFSVFRYMGFEMATDLQVREMKHPEPMPGDEYTIHKF